MSKQREERVFDPSVRDTESEVGSLTFAVFREIFDVGSLLKMFKTVGYWLIKPLGFDFREQQDRDSRFMGDTRLAKSLFLLLVVFLALGSSNQFVVQFMYLLSFVVCLWLFLAIGDLWNLVAGAAPENRRLFKSHLLYEFCTLFLIQGTALGVFGLKVSSSDRVGFHPLGATLVLLLPIAHGIYFFYKLGRFHEARRKAWGMIFIVSIITFYVFIPAVINMGTMQERGQPTTTATESSTAPDAASP